MNHNQQQCFPGESSHQIPVSLTAIEPITVTLPYPILPDSIKATLRRTEGLVEIVMKKALYDLWPEDATRHQKFRWNVENLQEWTNEKSLIYHTMAQFSVIHCDNPKNVLSKLEFPLTTVRALIGGLFCEMMLRQDVLFQLMEEGSPEKPHWCIRLHPPVRVSPQGTPIIFLSALDVRLQQQLKEEGKISASQSKQDFRRVFAGPTPARPKLLPEELDNPSNIYIKAEDVGLFRYILRLNSTKMNPTSWQKENLPLDQPSPWLATFLRPLYMEWNAAVEGSLAFCATCRKDSSKNPKRCGRCKSIVYCSVACQRADWPKHKPNCGKCVVA